MAGQNLFLIVFESEDDMELVMEGRPWLSKRQLIIFDILLSPIERNQIMLICSPFWLKIGLYSPESDKKDLIHAIGSTFDGVITLIMYCFKILITTKSIYLKKNSSF